MYKPLLKSEIKPKLDSGKISIGNRLLPTKKTKKIAYVAGGNLK